MSLATSKCESDNSARIIGTTLLVSLFVLITASTLFTAGATAQSGVSIQLQESDSSVSANTTVTQSQVPQVKPSQPLTFDNGNNYQFIIHDEDKGGTITTTPSVNVTSDKAIVLQNPLYPGVNTPSSYQGTFWILGVTSGPVDAPVSSSGSITTQGITNLSVSLVDSNSGNVIDRTKSQPYVIGYHRDSNQNSTTGQIQISVNQSVLPAKSNLTATVYSANVPYPKDTADKTVVSLSHNSSTNSFTGTFDNSSVTGGNYSVFYNGTLPQPYNTTIGKYFRNDISVPNTSSKGSGPGTLPGQNQPPTDPDNDGVYEDLNGDGSADLKDLQPFFNLVQPSATPPSNPSFFDINGDGRATLKDLQPFFNEVRP
jgi:hypothetical protein